MQENESKRAAEKRAKHLAAANEALVYEAFKLWKSIEALEKKAGGNKGRIWQLKIKAYSRFERRMEKLTWLKHGGFGFQHYEKQKEYRFYLKNKCTGLLNSKQPNLQ